MNKICLYTLCDFNYIIHFENFLNSFIINGLNNVHYEHFYIYTDNDKINNFNEKYNNNNNNKFNINFIDFNYYNKLYNYNLDKICFCANYRFDAALTLLNKKIYDTVVYLDVDSLINKSIYNIVSNINYDFSVYLRINTDKCKSKCKSKIKNYNENLFLNTTNLELFNNNLIDIILQFKKNDMIVMSGIFICKNTDNCKNLLNDIIKRKNLKYELNNVEWGLDQTILSDIFIDYINKIEIYVLPNTLFDFQCNPNNHIFFCKGKTYPTDRPIWLDITKYNSNILLNKCVLLVPIPKNASSSLKYLFAKNNILFKNDVKHLHIKKIKSKFNIKFNYNIISCIRNPYDRIYSYYNWHNNYYLEHYEFSINLEQKYNKKIKELSDQTIINELKQINFQNINELIYLDYYLNTNKLMERVDLIKNYNIKKINQCKLFKSENFTTCLNKTLNNCKYHSGFFKFIYNLQINYIDINDNNYFIKYENFNNDLNYIKQKFNLNYCDNLVNINLTKKNNLNDFNKLFEDKNLLIKLNKILYDDFKYFNYKIKN